MNPGKFQAIIFDKHEGNHTKKEMKAVSNFKLLGIAIDDKPNFYHRINNICKFASNQLNALI